MGGFIGDVLRGATGQDVSDADLTNIGLSMIPGVGSYLGAKEANQANAQQSQQQMAFQERMSNTAHQREVADLKAAGLNPILSANSGGASTPSGAMATMTNTLEGLGETGKGIMDLMNSKADLDTKQANIDLAKAQKANVDMDTTVKSKGVPAADITNQAYTYMKQVLKKAQDYFKTDNRTDQQKAIDKYMQDFTNRMKQKEKLP